MCLRHGRKQRLMCQGHWLSDKVAHDNQDTVLSLSQLCSGPDLSEWSPQTEDWEEEQQAQHRVLRCSDNKISPDQLCTTPGFTYITLNSPIRHHLFTSEGAWICTSDMDGAQLFPLSTPPILYWAHPLRFPLLTMQYTQPVSEPQESARASWTVSQRPTMGSFIHTSQSLLDTSENVIKSSSHNLGFT